MASDRRTFMWTVGLNDKFSRPMKNVRTQWTQATVAGRRSAQRFQRGIKKTGKQLRNFTADMKDSVTQVKSFSKVIVGALSLIGVGALAVGLIGALKKIVVGILEVEDQTRSLLSVTSAADGSMDALSRTAISLSDKLGENYETTVQMVQAMADIRPYADGAAGSFNEFANAVTTYTSATDASVDSIAELYAETERLTGETHGLRRLGDAMKYWADKSVLTNNEIQGVAKSVNSLLMMMPQGQRAGAQRQLVGLSAIFANAMGDPAALQQMFTEIIDVTGDGGAKLRAFVAESIPGGVPGLEKALAEGNYSVIFEALVKSARLKKQQLGGNLLRYGGDIQDMYGMDAQMIQALANVDPGTIAEQLAGAEKQKEAQAASEKRLNTVLKLWNRIKNTFINLIVRISAPLRKMIDKLVTPLNNLFDSLADSATTFVDKLVELTGDADFKNADFIGKIRQIAALLWETLSGDKHLQDFYKRIKSWFEQQQIGLWLGEKILYPALATVFSDWVAEKILRSPEERAATERATQQQRVRDMLASSGPMTALTNTYSPQELRDMQAALGDWKIFFRDVRKMVSIHGRDPATLAGRSAGTNYPKALDTAEEWAVALQMYDMLVGQGEIARPNPAQFQNR